MKNLKKLIVMFLIISICIVLNSTSYAAALQATINITASKTEVSVGDTVTFTMKLTDVSNAENGEVSAIGGKIVYDTNFFENITYTGVILNETTGQFTETGSFSNNSALGTITLKVKDNATGSGSVTFSELEADDGRENYAESTATTADKTFTISIEEASSGNTTTEPTNTTEENTTTNEPGNTTEENTTTNETANTAEENTTTNETGNTTEENTTTNKPGNTAEENTTTNKPENTAEKNNVTSETKDKNTNENNKGNVTKVKNLPYTGISSILVILLVVAVITSVIAYMKNERFKGIK